MKRGDMMNRGTRSSSHETRLQAERTEDMFESENNRLAKDLEERVSTLKSLSLDIGEEIDHHHRLLNGMDEEFGSTQSMLGGSMRRLKELSNSPNNRFMCYLVLFVVFVFFLIYYLMRR